MVTDKRRLFVTLSDDDDDRIRFLREKLGKKHQSEVMRAGLRALAVKHGWKKEGSK